MLLMPIIIFALGLLIGSFLNVVIFRMNTGRSVVHGRSSCARCSHTLSWYELVPVLSFLALRGKCRTCKLDISFQYPLVELVTGIAFVILYSTIVVLGFFGLSAWLTFIFAATVASILIVIAVYDLRHKIIPDMAVYSFILLSLVAIAWRAFMIPGFSVFAGLFEGCLVALPFFLLWYFSKGRLMGFGDVKLALGIGWLCGLTLGISVFVLAFMVGGIAGLFLLGLTKHYGMKSEVPFGPFLIIGVFIVMVWGVTIQSLFPLWV